jgi:hypothetical protein
MGKPVITRCGDGGVELSIGCNHARSKKELESMQPVMNGSKVPYDFESNGSDVYCAAKMHISDGKIHVPACYIAMKLEIMGMGG